MKPHVERAIARLNALDAANDTPTYLYHETRRHALGDIAREGLVPSSYGQFFVNEDSHELTTPADYTRTELRSCPKADLVVRTYVSLSEPTHLNYADTLLRFPRALAPSLTRRHDVDWYVRETVPPNAIEVRERDGTWRRLA